MYYPFKACRLLYVSPGLKFKTSAWRLHYIYVFCMPVRTNMKFVLYIINRLGFITQVDSVYCAVRTESLYAAFGESLCT